MTDLERVARVICYRSGAGCEAARACDAAQRCVGTPSGGFFDLARDCVRALLPSSEAMVEAGIAAWAAWEASDSGTATSLTADILTAMLGAVLKDEGK